MTLRFLHPTLAQALRFASLALTLADFFLGYASTIRAPPFIPAAVAMYWPAILAAAALLHQAASTFGVTPDAALTATLDADALPGRAHRRGGGGRQGNAGASRRRRTHRQAGCFRFID